MIIATAAKELRQHGVALKLEQEADRFGNEQFIGVVATVHFLTPEFNSADGNLQGFKPSHPLPRV